MVFIYKNLYEKSFFNKIFCICTFAVFITGHIVYNEPVFRDKIYNCYFRIFCIKGFYSVFFQIQSFKKERESECDFV